MGEDFREFGMKKFFLHKKGILTDAEVPFLDPAYYPNATQTSFISRRFKFGVGRNK